MEEKYITIKLNKEEITIISLAILDEIMDIDLKIEDKLIENNEQIKKRKEEYKRLLNIIEYVKR